jgi:hypothetical protein
LTGDSTAFRDFGELSLEMCPTQLSSVNIDPIVGLIAIAIENPTEACPIKIGQPQWSEPAEPERS